MAKLIKVFVTLASIFIFAIIIGLAEAEINYCQHEGCTCVGEQLTCSNVSLASIEQLELPKTITKVRQTEFKFKRHKLEYCTRNF